MALFARFLLQAQISILEIFNIFLWLKFSPSLNSNKNYHFSKVSFRVFMLGNQLIGLGWSKKGAIKVSIRSNRMGASCWDSVAELEIWHPVGYGFRMV